MDHVVCFFIGTAVRISPISHWLPCVYVCWCVLWRIFSAEEANVGWGGLLKIVHTFQRVTIAG